MRRSAESVTAGPKTPLAKTVDGQANRQVVRRYHHPFGLTRPAARAGILPGAAAQSGPEEGTKIEEPAVPNGQIGGSGRCQRRDHPPCPEVHHTGHLATVNADTVVDGDRRVDDVTPRRDFRTDARWVQLEATTRRVYRGSHAAGGTVF